jgi:hypothetical protein
MFFAFLNSQYYLKSHWIDLIVGLIMPPTSLL